MPWYDDPVMVEPDPQPLVTCADLLHKIANEFTRGLITRREYVDRTAFATMEFICGEDQQAA